MLTEMFHWLYSILVLPFISWEMDSENGKRSKQKNVKIFGITCRLVVLFLLQTTTRTYFNTIKKKKNEESSFKFSALSAGYSFYPFCRRQLRHIFNTTGAICVLCCNPVKEITLRVTTTECISWIELVSNF